MGADYFGLSGGLSYEPLRLSEIDDILRFAEIKSRNKAQALLMTGRYDLLQQIEMLWKILIDLMSVYLGRIPCVYPSYVKYKGGCPHLLHLHRQFTRLNEMRILNLQIRLNNTLRLMPPSSYMFRHTLPPLDGKITTIIHDAVSRQNI
ncbi:hypothetical protein D3C78_1165450 [compost metagenome]